ncbi:unnamed protein product [Kluyveromyces dobzhanskii CBS 2104]|uniref:WGS project CCBQ000000000 data, contig 00043 n=1 Tax=Kluyveromyces dobzhanskii CBS 2104 TaxID=1427455 RepID=A0A0A8L532_9SACH|nr:unnamed protein product [Kluyveromyces dobzhanskii CBS 2104]
MSKAFLRSAKNLVNGYSQAQVLVRKLTSNDKEGPMVDQLEELADRSFENVEFFEIMDMLDKRLNDKGRNWRHVAKSLTCLDYLVRCGSENCVFWCKENLYIIKTLREFTHTDEFTEIDHGEIVRVKAKELTALLRDEERLREERMMRLKGRKRGDRRKKRDGEGNENDDELQRALEESRITAEEEERRRKQLMMQGNDSSLQTALELSKEEEELRRLQQLQAQQQAALWQQQQQQQQQQQPMYYDIFGNPISAEEYMQYQQQQMLAQQQQEQYMAEQQYLAAQQQYLAQQQLLAQQQQQQQQQLLAQQQKQQFQMPYQTGSNNPFALNKPSSPQQTEEFEEPDFTPVQLPPSPVPQPVVQSTPQPVPKQRTGNQSVSDKFSELNNLLASGTGIDTFGNTGDTRLPAQHTKTGTFINSQGTGYKQVTNEPPKHNPFLTSQYTGIPSSGIAPSYTGYGFGNQPQSKNTQQNTSSNHYGNGTSNNPNLIDL